MKRQRLSAMLVLFLACVALVPVAGQTPAKRPLELEDILAYKAVGPTALSPNGQWFAYRMSPVQGDSDVVVRSTTGDKDMKFAVGEGTTGVVAFSDDSAWIAITTAPTRKEAQAAQRARKPVQTGVTIVNLATGDKVSIPKIRRFAFSGDLSGWIALHRYGPDAAAGGGAVAAGGRGGRGGPGAGGAANPDAPRDTSPKGTDLVLRELKTGAELNIGNVSEFGFNKSGKYLALIIDATDQAGNGIQLRDMASGTVASLETEKAFYERLAWTKEGDALVTLKGHDDTGWKERLYALVGFNSFDKPTVKRISYDPSKDSSFPKDMAVSGNRTPQWTDSRDAILFGIADLHKVEHRAGARGAGAGADAASAAGDSATGSQAQNDDTSDRPNLVIWHYKDPRLQSQQQVQETADRQFSYLSLYRVVENKFVRLADERIRTVTPPEKGTWAIGYDNTDYELMGNLDGRTYRDVYAINMQTGEHKLIKKQVRWGYGASPDGTKWLFYENRHFHVYDQVTGETRNITAGAATSFVNTEDDHNIVDPPTSPLGWTADSASVLISDRWDVWKVSTAAGATATNLTVNGQKDAIRYQTRVRIDPDEKGIDLTRPQYFGMLAEWTKKGGYGVLEPGQLGIKPLLSDAALFSRLQKAEKVDVWIYARETPTQAGDIYVTSASLSAGRQITNVGVESAPFLWTTGAMLLDYKNAKGERLQASLYLPANYEKGKQYPTVVQIYERETQGHNGYGRPTANGFSRQSYTSNGYAVLMPDIKYYVNDPGMSAAWALVPAVQAAIATGVVDPKRVGLHGHSWGGYQTAFTVTQTDVFAAAVAGAPLTDMISMYGIIYKNSGGTNGAIFESSQGRFTGGPWEQWAAYTRNSPVANATRVHTPLMILANDQDGAVDFTQGIEYFNTLRRLGKPVVLLEYPGENHGLVRPPNQQDYTVRMREFFDHYLKGVPSPKWLEDGVPRLKMQEHIDQRLKEQQDKQKNATPAAGQRGGGGGV